jgi:SAM-dependent methyltransferase
MSTRLTLFRELEKLCRGRPVSLYEEIEQMRRWLTDSRSKRPSGYMNMPKAFSAYAAFHLPLHLPKLYWVLEERGRRIFPKAPRRVLDLGCGPGTLTLSYILFASDAGWLPPETVDLVDFSKRALDGAERLVNSIVTPKTRVRTHRVHLQDRFGLKGKFQADLILLGHVLNEWGNGPRSRSQKMEFLERIIAENLAPGGRVIIVEPPLREPTTDLMWIRDRIANMGVDVEVQPGDQAAAASNNDDELEDEEDADEREDTLEDDEDFGDADGAKAHRRSARSGAGVEEDDSDEELDEDDLDESDEDLDEESEDDATKDDENEDDAHFGDDEKISPLADMEILAPCPGTVRFCPMIRNHMGWCYAQPPREWAAKRGLAPWDNELRRVTKTRLLDPGFAYLVLGRKAEAGAKPTRSTEEAKKSPAIAITDAEAPRPFLCTTKGAKQVRSVPFRGAYVERSAEEAPVVDEPRALTRPKRFRMNKRRN